jgi:L-glutamine:2-deoxy-scyllo-inosose/3-amino-2,3-dideoxy-scyllo-inosose aminotransferase
VIIGRSDAGRREAKLGGTTGTRPDGGGCDRLAIDGGRPVRPSHLGWPAWPVATPETRRYVAAVLDGGRWAISSPGGTDLFERRFSAFFADYVGVRHCVAVDHGSSALVVALEALRFDYGDVILVPALTWVASASAVFRAGLVPVLVDVDVATGCVDAGSVDTTLGARAMVVVHWACAMADVPALAATAAPHGITVIEDAAQAHGARWLGRSAGSLGRLGCFSMQQSKVLTGGEGGAVVTDDDELVVALQELRADSRSYRTGATPPGALDLTESAGVMGANFCLNELSAAVLCAQLAELDRQHAIRNRNYRRLAELLAGVPGVRLLRHRTEQTKMSIYEAALLFDPLPAGTTNAWIAGALSAELGVRCYPPREPLDRSRLLRPWTKPALRPLAERYLALHKGRTYPNAEHLSQHAVLFPHSAFLGQERDMADIASAVAKVTEHAARSVG